MRLQTQQVGPAGLAGQDRSLHFILSQRKALVGMKPINDVIKHVLKTLFWLLEKRSWG